MILHAERLWCRPGGATDGPPAVGSRGPWVVCAALVVGALMVPAPRAHGAGSDADVSAARLPPDRVRTLVERFRRARTEADREAAATELLAGGPGAAATLATAARAELSRLRQPYAARFQRAATDVLKSRWREGDVSRVAELRQTILDVAAAEGLTKETIVARSDPALESLERLLSVTPADVLAADPKLAADRSTLVALDDVARRCAAVMPVPERTVGADVVPARVADDLAAAEELACLLAGPLTPADRQTVAANAGRARDLDPEEARGMVRLNLIRVLVGLPAQAIDPGLVAACRVHSRDMEERGFFAHESPVSGRETPWRRAEAAGTSASAENIFSGSEEGTAAIRSWWHSPGHHKNMLGRQSRTGLGRWKGFWTQLFG